MACNENVVKNMANEITRNCQAQNVTVDPEFVIYLIDLLLLNPKYGRLFTNTINRNNLAYFVDECVTMILRGGTALNTLKMQFILQTNYDKLDILIEKHLDSINKCLRPLVTEILDVDPEPQDEAAYKKLFRKISIYIILNSGLGNPGFIVTLKEGMAALESVFSMDDLKVFVSLPRVEKMAQLEELLAIVSGVRLFNRDCKKGGEGIPDLPFNLVDAGKACLTSLSNSLISVMQRVNSLTTAIQDSITMEEETGNVVVDVKDPTELTVEDYNEIFELLAFNRQYEVFIRKLLFDVESMTQKGAQYVDKVKSVLEELHTAVKYKAAVPVVAVFPLFTKLWQVWRAMQNIMYLVSTVNRLMSILGGIQEQIKIPYPVLEKMLKGKTVVSDHDRMNYGVSIEDRMALGSIKNYIAYNEITGLKERHLEFLGFCSICLNLGALVPSIMKIGVVKDKGRCYGFCSVKMAVQFSKDPQRYPDGVLEFARNHPHLINLLNIIDKVYAVKDIDPLVPIHVPKIKVHDRDIQTEAHPVEEYHEKNYSWDLWEWKRRACQWATIVNCKTHSTQTNYSHLRSDVHCQTIEARNKCQQTKKDTGVNTTPQNYFLWGLRGQIGMGQHSMDLRPQHAPKKLHAHGVSTCNWPCIGDSQSSEDKDSSDAGDFYHPTDIQWATT
ncbi:cilia- and flagella-associated protein 206 isoform X2 [Anticarsia gemmatalis]|uniref:cilia- and flagella-associated protein 206 isoform X2 n=1 Tax=Anticarsia gemmatalis TaxID=129554 RepID=UPI003F7577E9